MADVTGAVSDSTTDRVAVESPGNKNASRVFVGCPDYKVFCWGIDITADVYGLQVSMQMDDQVSTAQVHVANDNEKWIMPTALSLINYDTIPDELSLGNNDEPLFNRNAPGTNTQKRSVKEITPVKFAKLKKANFRESIGQNGGLGESGQALLRRFTNEKNFPFLPGASLFQMGDPIRIFLKNPWNLTTKDVPLPDGQIGPATATDQVEEWYFAFTGYLASVTEDFDATTNRSLLHFYCEDVRRLLRYMRTTTNPNVFNLNVAPDSALIGGDANTFLKKISGDAILVSGNAAFQAGMKLVNTTSNSGEQGIMDLLLFGDTGQRLPNSTNTDTEPGMQLMTGVLGFSPDNKTISLLQGSSGGVEKQVSDILDDIYPILTGDDVERYGADWSLGSNPSVAPEPNHFYVIMPDKASFSTDGTDATASFTYPSDWGMRISYFAEFRSRLDIINEFVKAVDCVWYATPKGDIVLEFPEYDMIPQLHKPAWKSILQIQNDFTKFSMTEDDRNIKTFTIAQGSAIPGIDTRGVPPLAISYKFNPELAARYGVREQRDSRPFKYSEDYINSSLKSLAAMWQELANSDAYRLEGLECMPNFRACIGRPYFFKFRNMIGFCMGVHHQVVWGQLAQTIYDLRYIRHFDPETGTWQKISGQYGWFWGQNPSPIRDDSGSGARRIPFSSLGNTERQESDPSSDTVRTLVSDIRFKESQTGQTMLPENDKVELERIADRLDQPMAPDSTERQALRDKVDSIMSRIRA